MDDTFTVTVPIAIRLCQASDLPDLEWFGLFTEYRPLFAETFARQERGEVLMLVAVTNAFPIAQVWLDLTKKADQGIGVVWALRVLPPLQNRGIGRRLLAHAEALLQARGFAYVELEVSKTNSAAHRLYTRLGYTIIGENAEPWHYDTPEGERIEVVDPCWILQKILPPSQAPAAVESTPKAQGSIENGDVV